MAAVDTNVVVRLITRDDPDQVRRAEAFIATGAWVSQLVLIETVWVLGSAYKLDAQRIALVVRMLLEHEHLSLERPDIVRQALGTFSSSTAVGFADHLILAFAQSTGHGPLGTFDKKLAGLKDVVKL